MILQQINYLPTWKNMVISLPEVLGRQKISHQSIRSLCVSALLRFEVIERVHPFIEKRAYIMSNQSSLFGADDTPPANKKTTPASQKCTEGTGEPLAARMRPRTLDE